MNKITKYVWETHKIGTINDNESDDLFIQCISYEPRSVGVFNILAKDYHSNYGLFVLNKEFTQFNKVFKNKQNISESSKLDSHFKSVDFIETSIENPVSIILTITELLKKIKPKSSIPVNITFDITTFPRSEMMLLLYYLKHLQRNVNLRILYISPKKYGDWLSQGYMKTIIPPFFEGPLIFGKKTTLFLLTGYEHERAISLIDDIGPSKIVLGKPIPGTSPDFEDKSELIINEIRRTRKISEELFSLTANDPFICKDEFLEIIEKFKIENDIFVSVLGTKLQALGVYLAYVDKPCFRIIFSVPLIFNIGDYSSGCRDIYEIYL